MTPLPLDGIRVLDLTTTVFGPYTTQTLGDFGADVIKIEAPGGDTTRDVGPKRNDRMGALFLGANRNKRSLVLNLKSDDGREALWRLIDTADVFAHNMRPQKLEALGFGAKEVRARKSDIIYAGLHGFLSEGPYAGQPAYDDVVQGLCGLAGAFAERDGEPVLVPSVIVDKNAALMAANAILAAVIQRQRDGKGVTLELGMFEAMTSWLLVEHQYGATFEPAEGPAGYPRMTTPHRRPFRTKDGHLCMLAYTDRQWANFWRVAGAPQTASDERFATMAQRSRHIGEVYAAAGKLLVNKTTAEWLELLESAEIPAGPVNGFKDLPGDPHLKAIGFFRDYAHPSEGALRIPDTGCRLDGAPLPVRRHAPRLGEHTEEILGELGVGEDE